MKNDIIKKGNMKKFTKVQSWAIVVGIVMLSLGLFIGGLGNTKVITKEVPKEVVKEVPVTKEVIKEVVKEPDYTDWKKLKSIDDQIISLSADSMGLCSDGFYAVSELDVSKMNDVTEAIQTITLKMEQVGIERQTILRKLGY